MLMDWNGQLRVDLVKCTCDLPMRSSFRLSAGEVVSNF